MGLFYTVVAPILIFILLVILNLGLYFHINFIFLLIGVYISFQSCYLLFCKYIESTEKDGVIIIFKTKLLYELLFFLSLTLAFSIVGLSYEYFDKSDEIIFLSYCLLLGVISVPIEIVIYKSNVKKEAEKLKQKQKKEKPNEKESFHKEF